jgi:hypothetical protein
VVVRDGKLAGEWYFRGSGPNTPQSVFSVTKSVAGTLVGIAQDDGDLRIGASAATWIPQWRGMSSEAVTVRDLLSMDSGRAWSPLSGLAPYGVAEVGAAAFLGVANRVEADGQVGTTQQREAVTEDDGAMWTKISSRRLAWRHCPATVPPTTSRSLPSALRVLFRLDDDRDTDSPRSRARVSGGRRRDPND